MLMEARRSCGPVPASLVGWGLEFIELRMFVESFCAVEHAASRVARSRRRRARKRGGERCGMA
jgi:hypothetical protein